MKPIRHAMAGIDTTQEAARTRSWTSGADPDKPARQTIIRDQLSYSEEMHL
jgi:hypothetical protein